MNNNDQNFLVQKIRAQYLEKEPSPLDNLKSLDAKVKRPATVFGYFLGIVGALVMGSGMSLVLSDIGEKLGMGDTMIPGILIGLAGLAICLVNYPVFKRILRARRRKYAGAILAVSEKYIKE